MSRNRALSILVVLACASGLGAARGSSLPAPDPERGTLAISIHANPPSKLGDMPAVQVFFVNLDRDPDPMNAESVAQSSYSAGDQVYLLNAKPGRYVAVAARVRGMALSTMEFIVFLSRDMIPQTETTVVAGRMAFMGRYEVQTSTKMSEADPAQAYYFRLILPDASRKGFLTRTLSGYAPYTGRLTKMERDAQSASAFWSQAAAKSFKNEASWQERARVEISDPPAQPAAQPAN